MASLRPFVRRRGERALQGQVLGKGLLPRQQSIPRPHQRIVRRLDMGIGHPILVGIGAVTHQQARRHQLVEHCCNACVLCRTRIEQFRQQHTPAGEITPFHRHHTQHDALHGVTMRLIRELCILFIGTRAERADDTAQRRIIRLGQGTLDGLPILLGNGLALQILEVELFQGKREEGQRTWRLDHLVDQLVHQCRRIEKEDAHPCRPFNNFAQFALEQRRHDKAPCAPMRSQRQSGELGFKVRAQGQHNVELIALDRQQFRQQIEKCDPLAFMVAEGNQLFKLIDDQQVTCWRMRSGRGDVILQQFDDFGKDTQGRLGGAYDRQDAPACSRVGKLFSTLSVRCVAQVGQQSGLDQARLPRPRCTQYHRQPLGCDQQRQLFNQRLAAKEEGGMGFVVGLQAAVGIVSGGQWWCRRQIRHTEEKEILALIVLLQGPQPWSLGMFCRVRGAQLHLIAQVEIEFGSDDNTVTVGVAGPGQGGKEGKGEG